MFKSSAIRILIAENHGIFRDGLRKLLDATPGFRVIGEAADEVEAVELARQLKPDILLLGLVTSRHWNLQAARELESLTVPVRVVLLAATIDKGGLIEALRIGVRGIVPKESATRLLIKGIRTVMAGQYWLGCRGTSDVVGALRGLLSPPNCEAAPRNVRLTTRELEIVWTLVAGYKNKDIAQKFSLSEHTVKHHLTNIFDKVGVSNRLELALFAIKHDLVPKALTHSHSSLMQRLLEPTRGPDISSRNQKARSVQPMF